jgi:hypothetical protein
VVESVGLLGRGEIGRPRRDRGRSRALFGRPIEIPLVRECAWALGSHAHQCRGAIREGTARNARPASAYRRARCGTPYAMSSRTEPRASKSGVGVIAKALVVGERQGQGLGADEPAQDGRQPCGSLALLGLVAFVLGLGAIANNGANLLLRPAVHFVSSVHWREVCRVLTTEPVNDVEICVSQMDRWLGTMSMRGHGGLSSGWLTARPGHHTPRPETSRPQL